MNATFKKLKEEKCDAITFVPNPGNNDETIVTGLTYREKGETIGSSSMGDLFEIILFSENEEEFYDNDQFQAILVCPYTFSERMMNAGHFGMIARKTTTSDIIVEPFRNNINKLIGQPT